MILMGIVGLVLVIACANVANLMLARAAARRRETAVCLAIGAGRLRLVRHGLAEALLLAALGGGGELLFASWGTSTLMALVSGAWPIVIDLRPDARVLAFTMLVSCATAVLFGLAPALRAARVDPLPSLKLGAGSVSSVTRTALGRALVVTQIAVSLVLLSSSRPDSSSGAWPGSRISTPASIPIGSSSSRSRQGQVTSPCRGTRFAACTCGCSRKPEAFQACRRRAAPA